MKKIKHSNLLILVVSIAAATFATSASATRVVQNCGNGRYEALPLRLGSQGKRTCAIQWLLAGNRPSQYRRAIHPFVGTVTGVFDFRTTNAVTYAKWRLGYPMPIRPRVGKRLMLMMQGKAGRPNSYVLRSKARLRAQVAQVRRELHIGSHGRRVKDLQWLISGHRPSKFYKVVRPYRGRINGYYNRRTAKAVRRTKYLLGYPKLDGRAGHSLFAILLGKKHRPALWVALASKRIKAANVAAGGTRAARIVKIAKSQIGVIESPFGSNRGYRVDQYAMVTHTVGLAWCAAFVQWTFLHATGHTVDSNSAYVFYLVDWARKRGRLYARPKVGALAAFLTSQGHIGIVVATTRSGFYTVEGNTSNSVRERYYPYGYGYTVFLYL